MTDYSDSDYTRKGPQHAQFFREDGKRRKQFQYQPQDGPAGGYTSDADRRSEPKIKGSIQDAMTYNHGTNHELGIPGSVRGLTVDGSVGDALFPSLSDPGQMFPFYFKSLDLLNYNFGNLPIVGSLDFSLNEVATFQATIKSLNETISPSITDKHYFGRSEPVRVYKYTERKISVEFIVYAPSFASLQHVKERINFLVKSCYPTYESGSFGGLVDTALNWLYGNKIDKSRNRYKEPPIMMITVGDLFKDLPGLIQNLTVDWTEMTNRWELEPGARMPQVATVKMDYVVLHNKMPERTLGQDFYPGLQVDELYTVQGEYGSITQGQWNQTLRVITQDLDDGLTVDKLKQLGQVLGSKHWSTADDAISKITGGF